MKSVFLTSIILGVVPSIAISQDYIVGNTAELRQALEDSSANGQGDNILLKNGVYKTTDDNLGPFTFYDGENQDLTIEGEGGDAILDGDNQTQVLKVSGGSSFDFLLKNVTIRNGKIESYTKGAGLSTKSIKPTISHCTFYNNHNAYGYGGAISIEQVSEANIISSTIYDNFAEEGAGIHAEVYSLFGSGKLTVTNTLLHNNNISEGLLNTIFSTGSAINTQNGKLLLVGSTLANNSHYAVSTDDDSTFINNIFHENFNDISLKSYGDFEIYNNYINYTKLEHGDVATKKNNIQESENNILFKPESYELDKDSIVINKGIFTENTTFSDLVSPFMRNIFSSEEEVIRYREYLTYFGTDLKGNERIKDNLMDLGAFEYSENNDNEEKNTLPIATNDTIISTVNTNATIDVLQNDSDDDGDTLIVKSFDELSKEGGQVSVSNGILFYIPKIDFVGNDSFNYVISDEKGGESSATVTITVNDDGIVDTDRDGVPDSIDTDNDNDGMPDIWESKNGLDPLNSGDANADNDGDGVINLDEYRTNTSPQMKDTDGDGINDNTDRIIGRGLWGYACNIVNDPDSSTRRWGINQYNLALQPNTPEEAVYSTSQNRKIQSVACDPNGDNILFSMKDSLQGDYEIFELDISSRTVTQITDNDTDDVDVTRSRDNRTVAWQKRLPDNRQAIELRRLQENGEYIIKTMASASPFVQPSLSPNGQWLTFVQLRSNFFAVMRYDITNNKYKEIHVIARRKKLYHPSISDDGNKVGWSERISQRRYRVKDLTENNIIEVLNDSSGIEHAVLSGDGQQVIYSINTTDVNKTYLTSLSTLETQTIGATQKHPVRYLANNWSGGMASQGFTQTQLTSQLLTSYKQALTFFFRSNGSGARYIIGKNDASDFSWQLTNGVLTMTDTDSQHVWSMSLLISTDDDKQFTVSAVIPDESGGIKRIIDTIHSE